MKITTDLESTLVALKSRCNPSELFSKNLSEITQAEIAFIHAIAGGRYAEANTLSQAIPKPEPIRTLCTHPECTLSIYSDDSLFDKNNAQSGTWCDWSDFVDNRLDREVLNLSEREFFLVESPDDGEATDFVVNIRRHFFGPATHDKLAKNESTDTIFEFADRARAEAWISENEPSRDELYHCSHNEHSRPTYTVIAR